MITRYNPDGNDFFVLLVASCCPLKSLPLSVIVIIFHLASSERCWKVVLPFLLKRSIEILKKMDSIIRTSKYSNSLVDINYSESECFVHYLDGYPHYPDSYPHYPDNYLDYPKRYHPCLDGDPGDFRSTYHNNVRKATTTFSWIQPSFSSVPLSFLSRFGRNLSDWFDIAQLHALLAAATSPHIPTESPVFDEFTTRALNDWRILTSEDHRQKNFAQHTDTHRICAFALNLILRHFGRLAFAEACHYTS